MLLHVCTCVYCVYLTQDSVGMWPTQPWSQALVTDPGHRPQVTGPGHRAWSHRPWSQAQVTDPGHSPGHRPPVTGPGHRPRSQALVTGPATDSHHKGGVLIHTCTALGNWGPWL